MRKRRGSMKAKESRPVRRLIELGICRLEDIRQAKAEAEAFLSPEYSKKLRNAERLFGAIGEPNRIKILLLLSKREMCVCELESALGLPQPTISHHLGILEQAEMLGRKKNARWVFYRLRASPVTDTLKRLMS